MKNLTFLKLFVTTMFVMATALFAGCVDDNDDTELHVWRFLQKR